MKLAEQLIELHSVTEKFKLPSFKNIKKALKSFKKTKKKKKPSAAFNVKLAKKKQPKGFFSKIFKKLNITEAESIDTKKVQALAKFLNVEASSIKFTGYSYDSDSGEYLVLTDSEADKATSVCVEDTLFGFYNEFLGMYITEEKIIDALGLETSYYDEDAKEDVEFGDAEEVLYANTSLDLYSVIQKYQNKYEDGNTMLRKFLGGDFNDFVKEAINMDGRGTFLAPYDAEENEEGEYYIYRTD